MKLEFKRFQKEYYSEYAAWFMDPELDRLLGPMDQAWLEAVLSEPPSSGITWAVLREAELVAVIETVFDPRNISSCAIPALAVKPVLRRQGIGTAVLQHLMSMYKNQGISEYIAFISVDNIAGRRCVEKVGFAPADPHPDGRDYLEYRHNPSS